MTGLSIAEAALAFPEAAVEGRLEEIDGEPTYRVSNLDGLPPFLMSLVSDSDHWVFLSSTGALTAGRRDPDQALFPYTTDDRIHDSRDLTGGKTILRVTREGRTALWEPFSDRYEGLWRIERSLGKSVHGNRILFEETNHDLGLTLRCAWMTSERHGFVRRMALLHHGDTDVAIDLLDGLQNVLPHGLDRRFQMEYSTLADGYKRTELLPDSGLALFRLSSIPVDKAEPCEALRVNVAWCTGLDARERLLCSAQVGAFRRGRALVPETDVRGQRGAYLVRSTFDLEAGGRKDWALVAEVGLDATGVTALDQALRAGPDRMAELAEDVALGTRNLRRIVAGADGLQVTEDALSCVRHFSNALFNVMRGGVPADGTCVSRTDFGAFLGKANTTVAERFADFVAALPERLPRAELLERATREGDPDLERLASEYLPLTFSRRHGDPSRPWNIFSIRVKDGEGRRLLGYEGNWRDLFQNWEALAHAYPDLVEGMIHKFVDASTPDGHNPYRVTREGFEWEVVDPDDAWSFIGYWGDHQVIYLLKLLEASHRFHPGALEALLDRRVFTYADVPYRLAPYAAMLDHPRDTVTFDLEAHHRALARAAALGTDGLLVAGPEGLCRANLAEKLLLVVLAKLWSYVPEAGIWMNTQRPEWNDANNALVGYGVSLVTLAYLRRYLAFCADLFASSARGSLELGEELAELLAHIGSALETHAAALEAPIPDARRRAILDALGEAGTAYRTRVYQGLSGRRVAVSVAEVRAFLAVALRHVDHSLRANRREDGLYHSYNLMKATDDGIALRRLPEMLEGQVAVLSSGLLSGEDAADLLDALRASRLYRADQGSYTLYPDHPLPPFLAKNVIPAEAISGSTLLRTMLAEGDTRLVKGDAEGRFHFDAAFRNGEALRQALEGLKATSLRPLVEAEEAALLALYERIFDHQSFTGRSGTFYKYEGLGCIYWHMVSKLLLAVDEQRQRSGGTDPVLEERLQAHYAAIRAGLGIHKSPAVHGALPTDPYSHTPAFAGAQQPGMTGQVKEDLLARLGEFGVHVERGCLGFQPWKVRTEDFLTRPARFDYLDGNGEPGTLDLEPGTLAFTLCQVPVVLRRGGTPCIVAVRADGTPICFTSLTLDSATSREVFQRSGAIQRLEVRLGLG